MIIKEVTDENTVVRARTISVRRLMMYTSDATATKMVIISDMLLILRVYVMSGR